MHVAPFAKNRAHWYPSELYQRGRHCGLKLLLWRSESKVWLNLNIMAYVLEKGCEQVSHFVMPPMDKSAFPYPALHDRRGISYRPRTNWWGVLQCPAHLITTFRFNSVLCGFVALCSSDELKSEVTVILISFERLLLFWLLDWKQLN